MSDKTQKITAKEAEKILFKSGFTVLRQKGSHRIYGKGPKRIIIPHHSGHTLHPKILKEMYEIIQEEEVDE